jgi:signal transduction histidine kinase
MNWWNRRSETARDAVGAIPLVLIFVFTQQIYGVGGPLPRAVAVVLVIGLAMTFRRRWPVASYTGALAIVAVAQTGLELLAIVGYSLVAHEPRARPTVVVGCSTVAMVVGYLQYWPSLVLADIVGDLGIVAAIAILPVVLGRAVRTYRQTTKELQDRNTELVRLREQEARHAVQTERLRIARELHDVVAHHVSAMTVRARAGRHVAANDPQAASDALAYIAESGTATLTAMRTFVGTLREGGGDGVDGREGFAPQPGLDELPGLLESFRGTGLVVHAEVATAPAGIAPALGLNVHRIVQEGLTNVIRHAAAERAWVAVRFDADAVHIEIDDNGRGLRSDGPPPGHGLVGVAERAALHDGTSVLGASPRGGCRLEARLALGPDGAPEVVTGSIAESTTRPPLTGTVSASPVRP